jgi:hypothetical protein
MKLDFHLETPPQGREIAAHQRRQLRPAPLHATSLAVVSSAARPSPSATEVAPRPAEETVDVDPRRTSQPPPRRSMPSSPRPMPLPKNGHRHEPQHCRPPPPPAGEPPDMPVRDLRWSVPSPGHDPPHHQEGHQSAKDITKVEQGEGEGGGDH